MTAAKGQGHLLIVEDDHDLRELLATGLAASGFSVEKAASAEASLTFLEAQRFDVVLVDLNLPGMSGLELC